MPGPISCQSCQRGNNGHYYQFVSRAKAWQDASEYCASFLPRGHLAFINSAVEQQVITNIGTHGKYRRLCFTYMTSRPTTFITDGLDPGRQCPTCCSRFHNSEARVGLESLYPSNIKEFSFDRQSTLYMLFADTELGLECPQLVNISYRLSLYLLP